MQELKTYVIHVKGAVEREKYIKRELAKHNITFEFILDGNMEEITHEQLEKYFDGVMKNRTPQTSCALKHILAYENMIEENVQKALIFEDDIELFNSFTKIFNTSLLEIHNHQLKKYIISYENSTLQYVKRSERVSGQVLYKKDHSRCAGAYLIDIEAAKEIIQYLSQQKCDKPIDWIQHELIKNKKINVYWSHPVIAEQRSHNGKMPSLIDHKKMGFFRKLSFFLQKIYKHQILYRLR